jgi:hypothetical protein
MDANDVAAQKHWDAVASQSLLCGMTDDPGQFREPPLSGIFRHAQRELDRSRRGDDGDAYMTMPF